MRKILLYSLAAVVLGLLLILIPLVTIRVEDQNYAFPESFARGRGQEESVSGSEVIRYMPVNLEIFAISLVAASVAYLLFRRRISS